MTVTSKDSAAARPSRPHAHSLSIGSSHRITRRKSMSSPNANNIAAMAAVAKAAGGSTPESGRKSSKAGLVPRGPHSTGVAGVPNSMPNNGPYFGPSSYGGAAKTTPNAVADGPPLASLPENEKGNSKSRIRRASEGAHLRKSEGKRVSNGELKCETCGKGYKHSSCLTKHLWEHTPEWSITSKLLISKHQQVQLLEAASVLVAMNNNGSEAGDCSDHSSASPAASGSSDPHEDYASSLETTPPPQADDGNGYRSKRYSVSSSAFSQSYQSGASIFSDSMPNGHGFSHGRQWSTDGRPTTSATSVASNYDEEDQADLAAAVGLLSCSYGTPKSGPHMMGSNVPPVPPLPAKFLGRHNDGLSGTTVGQMSVPQERYSDLRHHSRDINMSDDQDEMEDDDLKYGHRASRDRMDEDGGFLFGRMEE